MNVLKYTPGAVAAIAAESKLVKIRRPRELMRCTTSARQTCPAREVYCALGARKLCGTFFISLALNMMGFTQWVNRVAF